MFTCQIISLQVEFFSVVPGFQGNQERLVELGVDTSFYCIQFWASLGLVLGLVLKLKRVNFCLQIFIIQNMYLHLTFWFSLTSETFYVRSSHFRCERWNYPSSLSLRLHHLGLWHPLSLPTDSIWLQPGNRRRSWLKSCTSSAGWSVYYYNRVSGLQRGGWQTGGSKGGREREKTVPWLPQWPSVSPMCLQYSCKCVGLRTKKDKRWNSGGNRGEKNRWQHVARVCKLLVPPSASIHLCSPSIPPLPFPRSALD